MAPAQVLPGPNSKKRISFQVTSVAASSAPMRATVVNELRRHERRLEERRLQAQMAYHSGQIARGKPNTAPYGNPIKTKNCRQVRNQACYCGSGAVDNRLETAMVEYGTCIWQSGGLGDRTTTGHAFDSAVPV